MYATLPVNTHSFATKCSTFAPRRTLSRTEGEGDIAATLSGRFPCVPDYGYALQRDADISVTLSEAIARARRSLSVRERKDKPSHREVFFRRRRRGSA